MFQGWSEYWMMLHTCVGKFKYWKWQVWIRSDLKTAKYFKKSFFKGWILPIYTIINSSFVPYVITNIQRSQKRCFQNFKKSWGSDSKAWKCRMIPNWPILTDKKARSQHFSAQPLIKVIRLGPKWHITVVKPKRIWNRGPGNVNIDVGCLQNTKSKEYNRNWYTIHMSIVEIGLKTLKKYPWYHNLPVFFKTLSDLT